MISFSRIQFRRGKTEVLIEQAVKYEEKEGLSSGKAALSGHSAEVKAEEESGALRSETPTNATDWISKMIEAFRERNLKAVEEAFQKYQESEVDGVKKLKEKVFYLWLKYDLGDTNALEELKDISNKGDIDVDIRHTAKRFLGSCYVQVRFSD